MRDFYRALDAELAEREGGGGNCDCDGNRNSNRNSNSNSGNSGKGNNGCDACGRCCRFDEADHILYASALERLYLAQTAVRPEHPDASPELLAAGLRCPFQKDNLCQAREGRTLGCRVHFCREEAGDWAEAWHERLKRLHETLGVEWAYAPLLPLPPLPPSPL